MGQYVPEYPGDEGAEEHNGNLPGEGGVFNPINFAVYHYAGNNPIKYTDPDGRDIKNNTDGYILGKLEDAKNGSDFVILKPGESYTGKLDGAILPDGTYIKVSDHKESPLTPNFSVENGDGKNPDTKLKFKSFFSSFVNALGDFIKGFIPRKKGDTSGVFPNEGEGHPAAVWGDTLTGEKLDNPANWANRHDDQKNRTDQQLAADKANANKTVDGDK